MLTPLRSAQLSPFDTVLRAEHCVLELADGARISLPVARWHAAADVADGLLLDRCTGPTLDIGCGPAGSRGAWRARCSGARRRRVTGRGPVDQAWRRRRVAARRLRRMPAVGRWRHMVLADGNIGSAATRSRCCAGSAELLQSTAPRWSRCRAGHRAAAHAGRLAGRGPNRGSRGRCWTRRRPSRSVPRPASFALARQSSGALVRRTHQT